MLGSPIGSTPIGASFASKVSLDSQDTTGGSSITDVDPEIAAVVVTLVTGNEAERRATLRRIMSGELQDRTALARALIRELSAHRTQTGDSNSSWSFSDDTHAAARSWLRPALIWCQPEDTETIDIAQQGMSPSLEPVTFVRFWTLAALYGVRATYLGRIAAFAADDPAWDVAVLARMIVSPESPELIAEMRSAFDGSDPRKLHGILRALRVAPVPQLAGEVAGLLRSDAHVQISPYDIFCALATPPMASAAANLLSSNPGFDAVLGRMVISAASIDKTTAKDFAQLMVAMNAGRSESFLREREAVPELRSGARILLDGLSAIVGHQAQKFRQLPGFIPDTIDNQADHLDIQPEVDTLTAIIMAKDVTPPLAIGLFGEWGTGKSFFMSRMKKAVAGLIGIRAQTEGSPFCANAVQIHFNAWHYADTNLWASLVSSIFESLDSHLRGKDVKPDEREVLLEALLAAQTAKEAALADEAQASERLKQEQASLAAAAAERENTLNALSSLQASDLVDLLGATRR
jgi:hypothetical protein